MKDNVMHHHTVVSREAWVEARRALLAREKQLTRERDEVTRLRRDLPWARVEKNYVFDAAGGPRTLADLFCGRSQLVVQHFMFGPDWNEGCPSCSFMADHVDGALPHLAARDVTFVAISRAPLPKIEAFKRRMGWRFDWVSSHGNDFNYNYHVSFTPEEMARGHVYYNYAEEPFPSSEGPGLSVFSKDDAAEVFHTYSTFARGVEGVVTAYTYLDLVPKGRDEDGLKFSMEWVRHHDRYAGGDFLDPSLPYWPPEAAPVVRAAAATPDGGSCGCASATH